MKVGTFLAVASVAFLPSSATGSHAVVAFATRNVAGRRPFVAHDDASWTSQRPRTCGSRKICRPMMLEVADMVVRSAVTETTTTPFMPSTLSLASLLQTSPEPIHTVFSVATFAPQPFWLLIILLPGNKLTKQIMGGLGKCNLNYSLAGDCKHLISCD